MNNKDLFAWMIPKEKVFKNLKKSGFIFFIDLEFSSLFSNSWISNELIIFSYFNAFCP
tara:strand:+ start:284 stop:457 length:174 start_codon:yes stop_codon:yes gene_type:complete